MEIIGVAGTKRSGKSSCAKFISGVIMQRSGVINKYDMDSNGDLIVNYEKKEGHTISRGMGIFDLDRKDDVFMNYLSEVVWPHVKIYNFADSLKWILINMYGFSVESLFGGEKKDSPSHIKWEQMVDIIPKKKLKKNIMLDSYMSNREAMQYFGDVLRNIDTDCFIKHCVKEIQNEQCPVAIIGDVRRKNEVDAIKALGGKVIYLTRKIDNKEQHDTETELTTIDSSYYDLIINNEGKTINEKNDMLYSGLKELGLFE